MKIKVLITAIILACITFNLQANNQDLKFYTLQYGEEFVYGKIGTKKDGQLHYKLAILRKANPSKQVYTCSHKKYDFSGIIQGDPVLQANRNAKSYMKYDFYVVFNDKKFGPYDGIFDLNLLEPNIDKWVSEDGKSISFSAQKRNQYVGVVHNKELRKFYTGATSPRTDKRRKNNLYSSYIRKDYFIAQDQFVKTQGWKYIDHLTCYNSNNYAYIAKKNDRTNLYVNGKSVYSNIIADTRSLDRKMYYDMHPGLRMQDHTQLIYDRHGTLFFRVKKASGAICIGSVSRGRVKTIDFSNEARVGQLINVNGRIWCLTVKNEYTTVYGSSGNIFTEKKSFNGHTNLIYQDGFFLENFDQDQIKIYGIKNNELSLLNNVAYKKQAKNSYREFNGADYYLFTHDKLSRSKLTQIEKNGVKLTYFKPCTEFGEIEYTSQSGTPVITTQNRKGNKTIYNLYIGNQLFTSKSKFEILHMEKGNDNVYTYTRTNKKIEVQKNGKKLFVTDAPNVRNFMALNGHTVFYVNNKFYRYHDIEPYNLDRYNQNKMYIDGKLVTDGRYGLPKLVKSKGICTLKERNNALYFHVISN